MSDSRRNQSGELKMASHLRMMRRNPIEDLMRAILNENEDEGIFPCLEVDCFFL